MSSAWSNCRGFWESSNGWISWRALHCGLWSFYIHADVVLIPPFILHIASVVGVHVHVRPPLRGWFAAWNHCPLSASLLTCYHKLCGPTPSVWVWNSPPPARKALFSRTFKGTTTPSLVWNLGQSSCVHQGQSVINPLVVVNLCLSPAYMTLPWWRVMCCMLVSSFFMLRTADINVYSDIKSSPDR